MSTETLPTSQPLQERELTGESYAESIGQADGVAFVVEVAEDLTRKATIEYGDLIKRIRSALILAGYNPKSKCFDATIVNWLSHHCQVLPVDGIKLISTESDWKDLGSLRAPWFNLFEDIQKQSDVLRGLFESSMPFDTRTQVEMYLGDKLLWSSSPNPNIS